MPSGRRRGKKAKGKPDRHQSWKDTAFVADRVEVQDPCEDAPEGAEQIDTSQSLGYQIDARNELRAKVYGKRPKVHRSMRQAPPRSHDCNIQSIGVGLKRTGSHFTGEIAIKVLVRKKLAKSKLSSQEILPKVINGMPTDIEEVGEVRAFAAGYNRRFPRPVPCGVSCAHFAVGAGTIGCLVALADGSLAMLSNNHVLANENNAGKHEVIIQPGRTDRGAVTIDKIGVIARFVTISFTRTNYVDAAVAYTKSQFVASTHVTYRVNPNPLPARERLSVIKNGRRTGSTEGIITAIGMDTTVRYRQGQAYFDDQIVIQGIGGTRFSMVGDSGSLVVAADTFQPVGLLFAGDRSFTYANPIQLVMSALKIARIV